MPGCLIRRAIALFALASGLPPPLVPLLIRSPWPLTRMTVPQISTVSASRSSVSQVIAEFSSMRLPVVIIMSTKFGRSRFRAFWSAASFARRP